MADARRGALPVAVDQVCVVIPDKIRRGDAWERVRSLRLYKRASAPLPPAAVEGWLARMGKQ